MWAKMAGRRQVTRCVEALLNLRRIFCDTSPVLPVRVGVYFRMGNARIILQSTPSGEHKLFKCRLINSWPMHLHRRVSSFFTYTGKSVLFRFPGFKGSEVRKAKTVCGQHVGFVVDKAALGQVFPEYFGFPCQSFHRFLHYHNHPGLTQ
jgi:hypothetical protein